MGEGGEEVGHLERRMDAILRLVFGNYAQDRGPSSSKIVLTIAVTVQTSRHICLGRVLNLQARNPNKISINKKQYLPPGMG